MNWAKGGTKTGRGASLKATCDYVLHDKDGMGDDRVGEVEMLNLAAEDPKRAWREMQTTVEAVAAIKARNGIPQTGSKNARPVYAISLSWHPDDKPGPAHMMETARGVIGLLGLSKHQAMIVQHKDRPHPHVHIVVNLINPETGKTASLRLDEKKLGAWAHAYESARVIRSFNRAAKFERNVAMDKNTKTAFEKALQADTAKVRSEITAKKTGLSAKHEAAADGRKQDREAAIRAYREKREAIMDKYQPILDEIWRRKPKTPALELTPPGMNSNPEWKGIAKAMLATGMAKARYPLRHRFTASLSKISDVKGMTALAKKFTQAREGIHIMSPVRTTPESRSFVRAHGRPGRSEEVKRARHAELAAAAKEYGITKAEVIKKHTAQIKGEKAEIRASAVDAKKAWNEVREKAALHLLREEHRQANIARFQKAAKDKDRVVTQVTADEWQVGTIGKFSYRAKMHEGRAVWGMKGESRIVHLDVRDAEQNRVAHYDQEWKQRPYPWGPERKAVDEIVKFYIDRDKDLAKETQTPAIEEPAVEKAAEQPQATVQQELFTEEQLDQTTETSSDLQKAWEAAIERDRAEALDRGM